MRDDEEEVWYEPLPTPIQLSPIENIITDEKQSLTTLPSSHCPWAYKEGLAKFLTVLLLVVLLKM